MPPVYLTGGAGTHIDKHILRNSYFDQIDYILEEKKWRQIRNPGGGFNVLLIEKYFFLRSNDHANR